MFQTGGNFFFFFFDVEVNCTNVIYMNYYTTNNQTWNHVFIIITINVIVWFKFFFLPRKKWTIKLDPEG